MSGDCVIGTTNENPDHAPSDPPEFGRIRRDMVGFVCRADDAVSAHYQAIIGAGDPVNCAALSSVSDHRHVDARPIRNLDAAR